MGRIKREIAVTVKTADGHTHRLAFEVSPRSISNAFLTAVGLFPNWAKVIIEVTKEPAASV